MDRVLSQTYNLEDIIKAGYRYTIPRYQRLYVWEDDQVKTFFHDILSAAKSGKEFYFIGGIIVVRNRHNEQVFDLVDGQQRFTTLWLLTNELGPRTRAFSQVDNDLRLGFAIRPLVKEYFSQLSSGPVHEESRPDFDELVKITNALNTLKATLSQRLKDEAEIKRFITFLMNQVKMVITEVPRSTDLTKLFETLNNRGEQLAQHEILKATLLSKITNRKMGGRYALLWSACSDMENYIERSLNENIDRAWAIADAYDSDLERFKWKNLEELLKDAVGEIKPLKLKEIVAKRKKFAAGEEADEEKPAAKEDHHPETSDEELYPVSSILTFPQLLLHTLRIFLYRQGQLDIARIDEKELIATFSQHLFTTEYKHEELKKLGEEREAIQFLELLFTVREVFDTYVIKWVYEDRNDKYHVIKEIDKQRQSKGKQRFYLRRFSRRERDGLALLQSILYHSQENTTQYWLTPFMNRLLDFPSWDEAYVTLKRLDNLLFCTRQEKRELVQRTWECMEHYPDLAIVTSILFRALGTGFPHYWFYKLEFVLWHERISLGKGKSEVWNNYRMTARNSIEHVSPQNPREPDDKLCETQLDNFGNLVLVTRSINSEYSDLSYRVKQAKFIDKKKKGSLDSLKSDLIYEHRMWNDRLALEHQENMIALMANYFHKTMNIE